MSFLGFQTYRTDDGILASRLEYNIAEHAQAYVGINSIPLAEKDDHPEAVVHLESAVYIGRSICSFLSFIFFDLQKKLQKSIGKK